MDAQALIYALQTIQAKHPGESLKLLVETENDVDGVAMVGLETDSTGQVFIYIRGTQAD